MRFTVPQFIEQETKIVGPFTFKQFIFVAMAGTACFILYHSVSFTIFLIASLFLGVTSLVLAFLEIGGRSFPVILNSFLKFNLMPKMYIWKKSEMPIKIIKKEIKKEEKEERISLKINKNSQLKKLKTEIETKTK